MKKIIVHFPFKIDRNRASASQLRPIKIIETFKSMGYDVYLVEGYGKERKKQITRIKSEIRLGGKFEFVYSECNTTPTLLTEKHHFPTYPFLDFSFWRFCKKNGINIGLFYRDIFWCSPDFNKGIVQRALRFFYKYDLRQYNKFVSALFVPSYEMISHLKYKLVMPIHELYPGCDKFIYSKVDNDYIHTKINILFIGGIGVGYDLRMFMKVVKSFPMINFTLCCRSEDWEIYKTTYTDYLGDNIEIVHKSGAEKDKLYSQADLFCMFVKPIHYWEFAVPFKLFEAIGHGCPLITTKNTWCASFVQKNNIGYVSDFDEDSLSNTLQNITSNYEKLKSFKKNVEIIAKENTWEDRCKKIDEILSKNRS